MLYAIVGMLVIILDQGVKYWVTNNIMLNTVTEPLLPGVLSLVRMHNDGAVFSFLAGGGARVYFVILTAVFTIAVILALATNFINGKFGRWCLVLVTAGGLSNCLDRILYGFVVDMFKIDLFDFAVFNVADIFITVFSLLFILYIIFGGENRGRKAEEAGDEFDYEPDEGHSLREDIEFTMGTVKAAKPERKRQSNERVREEKPERRISRRGEEEEPEEKPTRRSRAASSTESKPRYEFEYPQDKPVRKPVRTTTEEDDPFAAWERASVIAETAAAESPAAKAMETKPRYSTPIKPVEERPARAAKPAEERPARTAKPAKSAEEKSIRTAAPAEQKPARTAAPKAPKKPKPEVSEDFSLDDILAEFRD